MLLVGFSVVLVGSWVVLGGPDGTGVVLVCSLVILRCSGVGLAVHGWF